MTLNQLVYYETLAETENMRKAAEKLYISQPSLSVSMAKLEQELQVELFLHQGRKVELTDAGRLFLEHVKKILKDIQEAKIHMERLGEAGATSVRIGCITPILQNYLPGMMQAFLQIPENRGTRFSFSLGITKELIRGLRQGQYDFLICTEMPADDIDMKVIRSDRLVLIGPEEEAPGAYSWEEIRKHPLIGYEKESQMAAMLNDLSRRHHLNLSFSFNAPNEDAICALVEHGMGYAIIPYVSEVDNYHVTVHEIPEVIVRNTCVATMKNDHTIGIMAKRFIRFLLEQRHETDPLPLSGKESSYNSGSN